MEFVHLQILDVHHHRYELFDLFDHGLKFYRYQMKYHDQHASILQKRRNNIMKLHELQPAAGSRKVRNRVGRGTS